uniref:Peptidase M12A domain-containing protein n=1 Tax=Parascaris equorum TaxID=6256 RepID=A0A914S5F6_PAREQ
LKAFSSETLRHTVDPIDTKYRSTIGNRVAPSFTDIKQINHVYCAGVLIWSTLVKMEDISIQTIAQDVNVLKVFPVLFVQILNFRYPGGRVRFEVTDVFFKCSPTCSEFLEIKYAADMQLTGFRLCCFPEGGAILSEGPFIIVIIRAVAPSRFALRYISDGGQEPLTSEPVGNSLGVWSAWSTCSERCGACGLRTRRRVCQGRACR